MSNHEERAGRHLNKPSQKSGLAPGSLVSVALEPPHPSRVTLIDYDVDQVTETEVESVSELKPYLERETVTWVHVEGLSDVKMFEQLANLLDIHPLVIEDILNTHQRPKFEDYERYLFIVLKAMKLVPDGFEVKHEQVSMIVFENLLISFSERPLTLLEPVKQRIRNTKGRFRRFKTDYLAYGLMDAIVDDYFVLVDELDEVTDELEDELLYEPDTKTLEFIQQLKRETIFVRRAVVPVREIVAAMLRSDSELIYEQTMIYLRDVSDHAIRVAESMETYRDIISGMLDIYLSSASNKMNETMKILTIFSTIFIPLTFIAGVYGMNFEYMPELHWKWAYPAVWVLFVLVALSMLRLFRRHKWL